MRGREEETMNAQLHGELIFRPADAERSVRHVLCCNLSTMLIDFVGKIDGGAAATMIQRFSKWIQKVHTM